MQENDIEKGLYIDTNQTKINSYLSITKEQLSNQQQKIYDCLCQSNEPLTDEEIWERTGMNPNSERPRRGELVHYGLVVPSELKKTRSGKMAVSWTTKNKLYNGGKV